jgi:ribonuclease J
MKACIHRGTKEIGGTCIELESQGRRIVLDVGLPLDVDDPDAVALYPVRGFAERDETLLGVVISHPHRDHYGLAHRLPADTPFLIGRAAREILSAAGVFTPSGLTLSHVTYLEDRGPIHLGPFTLTPYLVDHSAYDAYALLVEADDTRVFYSGDFRAHGRKAKLFDRLINDPPRNVDVLFMEGTTIGRSANSEYRSESDLEHRLADLFRQTPGMPLVWCSGQNIDRLVTVYRACKRAGRQFIVDMYTAHVLRATGNANVPQAEWPNVRVFLPSGQKHRIIESNRFDVSDSYRGRRIFPEELKAAAPTSVMLFRPSMIRDLERSECLDGARVVHSMWSGYLGSESAQPLHEWAQKRNIGIDACHTSGHASVSDLKRLRDAFHRAKVVPIHTSEPARFDVTFGNAISCADGNWWNVD